jgi:hypothetical protein
MSNDNNVAPPKPTTDSKGPPTIQPSGHDGWCTPPSLIEYILQFAGGAIALDPCSNPYATLPALLTFYKEHEGLEKDWATELKARGLQGLVYVNPPYDANTLDEVTFKCAEQACKGLEVLALVPCKLDQDWWQDTVFETASALCFVKGRIKFWKEGKPTSGAPMPCAFLYWGPRSKLFQKVFSHVGMVMKLRISRKSGRKK